MSKPTVAYLQSRIDALQEKLDQEILKEHTFGKVDPWEEETVLLFKRQFNGYGRPYTYAALKVGGFWYITGRTQSGYRISYQDLVDEFLQPALEETGEIWAASEWIAAQ